MGLQVLTAKLNGSSKETKIGALWVKKGKVYPKPPRLCYRKWGGGVSGISKLLKGTGAWEEGNLCLERRNLTCVTGACEWGLKEPRS